MKKNRQEFRVSKRSFDENEDRSYVFSISRFFNVTYNADGSVSIRMTGKFGDKTTIRLDNRAMVTALTIRPSKEV